ncbi:MAG: peptidoglycan D,D-transpeptidase FtsI family protein [Kangiellaceae bacterium]
MSQNRKTNSIPLCSIRFYLLCGVLMCAFVALMARAVYLQVDDSARLVKQADSRSLRTMDTNTFRGNIYDRNGVELASSVPVKSVWMDITVALKESPLLAEKQWNQLAVIAKKKPEKFKQWIHERSNRKFAWIARHLDPQTANLVAKLNLPGVRLKNESRRYYPSAEISAHLVGFTNVDDEGQEGLEMSYNDWLTGQSGEQQVRMDLGRQVIEQRKTLKQAEAGENLYLSIDSRIQAIAYKAMKTAVLKHKAKAGALVMIDVESGEILSLVSQPSYNPNRFDLRIPELTRNRAFTDNFEPGSTAKPFTVASALEANIVTPETKINTSPGRIKVGPKWISDGKNYATLDVAGILQKSSNVGVTKLALQMNDQQFLKSFYNVGFGVDTASGFPGESSGKFDIRRNWSDMEKAILSYGYGFSVTPVQLANAYAVLGSGGIKRPLSLIKIDEISHGERAISEKVASQVMAMMETVVDEGGTGKQAQVEGYRIAGKTGTARKAKAGSYGDEYSVFFAGVAPVSNPKIAMVIFVDEPRSENYYGGQVAAPVFAKVASDALRILNVRPDKKITHVAATQKNIKEKTLKVVSNE